MKTDWVKIQELLQGEEEDLRLEYIRCHEPDDKGGILLVKDWGRKDTGYYLEVVKTLAVVEGMIRE